ARLCVLKSNDQGLVEAGESDEVHVPELDEATFLPGRSPDARGAWCNGLRPRGGRFDQAQELWREAQSPDREGRREASPPRSRAIRYETGRWGSLTREPEGSDRGRRGISSIQHIKTRKGHR